VSSKLFGRFESSASGDVVGDVVASLPDNIANNIAEHRRNFRKHTLSWGFTTSPLGDVRKYCLFSEVATRLAMDNIAKRRLPVGRCCSAMLSENPLWANIGRCAGAPTPALVKVADGGRAARPMAAMDRRMKL
jgi:hypothetical protein